MSRRPGHDAGDYPPIARHAFVSDGHTGALIGPDGAVDWMPAPRFDGEAVFARLLDRSRGGALHLEVDGAGPSQRRYVPGTLVVETRWSAGGAQAVAHDFLAIAPSTAGANGPRIEARHVLVRLVRCMAGRVTVRATADARPGWGRAPGGWSGGGEVAVHDGAGLWLTGDPRPDVDGGAPSVEASLGAGDAAVVALGYGDAPPRRVDRGVAERLLDDTLATWRAWSALTGYAGAGAEQVAHSATVLRGLIYEPTGAMLAAPTTSLPEWIGGERNWDYRYTWHRDAALAVLVLLRLGHTDEARRYLRFLLEHDAHMGESLEPVLGIGGEADLPEETIPEFEGYARSAPVRIGNGARGQEQLDSYGHVLDAALAFHEVTGELTVDEVGELCRIVEMARERWREPEHGIWEVRGEPRHWTNSKLMAWTCLDRGIRLAEMTGERRAPVDDWRREMHAVREDVLAHGFDPSVGAFVQHYGARTMDASLLRIPLLGFLAGDDPRVLGTLERIDAELGSPGGLIHRYDVEATADGFEDPEGAFFLCSFDMVSALVLAGRAEEARRRFEALCAHGGELGLLAEQVAGDGTMLGNYPQAFSHLGLIEAAMNVDAAGRREALHDWAERQAGARSAPR